MTNTGGVYVYAGRPMTQIAHVKAETQAPFQYFGQWVSAVEGGVMAVGALGQCRVHVMDLW